MRLRPSNVAGGLTCKMRLLAVADTTEEARYQARQRGRSTVASMNIQEALLQLLGGQIGQV